MRSVTAIILSRDPVSAKFKSQIPKDVRPLNFISDIKSFQSYQRSWFMAVQEVQTEWFFFLDHDDRLPDGFSGILDRLLATAGFGSLAYTNEVVVNDAGIHTELKKGPYSQESHLRNPMLCHHLVLGRTETARQVIEKCPRGHFMPEMMVYFQMAKKGAIWLDEAGYLWHRSHSGMSYWPSALAAQVASIRWSAQNAGEASLPPLPLAEDPAPVPEPALAPATRKSTRKAKEF